MSARRMTVVRRAGSLRVAGAATFAFFALKGLAWLVIAAVAMLGATGR